MRLAQLDSPHWLTYNEIYELSLVFENLEKSNEYSSKYSDSEAKWVWLAEIAPELIKNKQSLYLAEYSTSTTNWVCFFFVFFLGTQNLTLHYKHRFALEVFSHSFFTSSPPDPQRLLQLSSDTPLSAISALPTMIFSGDLLGRYLTLSKLLLIRPLWSHIFVSWSLIFS